MSVEDVFGRRPFVVCRLQQSADYETRDSGAHRGTVAATFWGGKKSEPASDTSPLRTVTSRAVTLARISLILAAVDLEAPTVPVAAPRLEDAVLVTLRCVRWSMHTLSCSRAVEQALSSGSRDQRFAPGKLRPHGGACTSMRLASATVTSEIFYPPGPRGSAPFMVAPGSLGVWRLEDGIGAVDLFAFDADPVRSGCVARA
jgi:hypothetical protein